jgi:hypothetical protein
MVGTYAQRLYSLEGRNVTHSGPWQAIEFEVGRSEAFGVDFVNSGPSIHLWFVQSAGAAHPRSPGENDRAWSRTSRVSMDQLPSDGVWRERCAEVLARPDSDVGLHGGVQAPDGLR